MLKKDRYRGNTFFKNPEYLDAIRNKVLLDNRAQKMIKLYGL